MGPCLLMGTECILETDFGLEPNWSVNPWLYPLPVTCKVGNQQIPHPPTFVVQNPSIWWDIVGVGPALGGEREGKLLALLNCKFEHLQSQHYFITTVLATRLTGQTRVLPPASSHTCSPGTSLVVHQDFTVDLFTSFYGTQHATLGARQLTWQKRHSKFTNYYNTWTSVKFLPFSPNRNINENTHVAGPAQYNVGETMKQLSTKVPMSLFLQVLKYYRQSHKLKSFQWSYSSRDTNAKMESGPQVPPSLVLAPGHFIFISGIIRNEKGIFWKYFYLNYS